MPDRSLSWRSVSQYGADASDPNNRAPTSVVAIKIKTIGRKWQHIGNGHQRPVRYCGSSRSKILDCQTCAFWRRKGDIPGVDCGARAGTTKADHLFNVSPLRDT